MTGVSTRTTPPSGKEAVHVRIFLSRAMDVDDPGDKRMGMNILLWLRMKWLKLQQERIERKICKKGLHWPEAGARPTYDQLTAVTHQKNALGERLGRRTD